MFQLQDALNALSGDGVLDIATELDVPELAVSGLLHATLNRALEAITTSPETVCDETTFDALCSLLKYHETLSASVFSRLVDAVTSALDSIVTNLLAESDADLETYRGHRPALEHLAFLLYWSVAVANRTTTGDATTGATEPRSKGRAKAKPAAGKGKAPETGTWADTASGIVAAMCKALRLRTDRIWTTTQERDTFVSCLMRTANMLAESDSLVKIASVRLGIADVFALSARSHGQTYSVRTTVLQNLQYFEHLAEPMAEIVSRAATQHDYADLADEVLREISAKTFSAQDSKGPRSFSRFLVALAEGSPRLVAKHIVLLQKHLDSEAHTMRMAVLDLVGILIVELSGNARANEDTDPAATARQFEGFFALLADRFLDVNAFVRSKAVSISVRICDLPTKFPRQRLELCKKAVRSLGDKSSQVRKHCIALLCRLIQTHPYGTIHGGTLALKDWQGWHDEIARTLAPLENADAIASPHTANDSAAIGSTDMDAEATSAPDMQRQDHAEAAADEHVDLAAFADPAELSDLNADQITMLRLQKRYYTDALAFIASIAKGVPAIADLLTSKVKTESLEAMDFFCIAHEYNIDQAEIGIKRMLHLIWAKDNSTVEDGKEVKGVKSRVIECYRKLFFDALADRSHEDNVARTTRNMISLTENATLAELTSLEQLMNVLMSTDAFGSDVIRKLWQVYDSPRDIARTQRRGAIILLGMLATAKPEVISENTDTLLNIGLGNHGRADLTLAKYTCLALRRIAGSQKKVKGSLVDATVRLSNSSPIFERLRSLVEAANHDPDWFAMAEQAINTIFVLSEQPDRLASSILQSMTKRVFADRPPADSLVEPSETAPSGEQTPPEDSQTGAESSCERDNAPGSELAHLLFVAGHCAIKQLIHFELVEREYKRRKAEADKTKAAEKGAVQDELDQVAGSVEDDVADALHHAREEELLYGVQSILSVFAPMSAQICSQPSIYKGRTLRIAATLSMAKFMCVSAKFCEAHLMLLFKILETASSPVTRSNIVIALGDIAVCFSNIMDENSDRLYLGLRDADLAARKTTLMVLTHLILHGLLKVKGQLSELAKLVCDDNPRIRDLARLFFEELATKDNAIYNNLPDIISHLSISGQAVSEDAFCDIADLLFTFIDKEKQAESIVEKFCQRFKLAADDERQWRDIAYCLSLLPYKSERSIGKLVEGLPLFEHALREPVVFARFTEILTKARNNKGSGRSEVFEAKLKDFEQAMASAKTRGEEQVDIERRVLKKKQTRGSKAKRGRRREASSTPSSSP